MPNSFGGALFCLLVWILSLPPTQVATGAAQEMALLSLFFPVYYMAASWLVTLRVWRRRRRQHVEEVEAALS